MGGVLPAPTARSTDGSVRVLAGNVRVASLPVTCVGRSLIGGQLPAQNGLATLYATTKSTLDVRPNEESASVREAVADWTR